MLLLFSPAVATLAHAATINAASCNQSDVNAVINGPTHTAVDGDVIQIPSGSCTWTSGLAVPSGIGVSIVGAGTPNSAVSTMGANSSCTSTTITVSGGITAFKMRPSYGNSTTRLSCMDIASGSGSGIAFSVLGTCASSGCPNLRVDNVTFDNWAGHASAGISYGISAVGDMFGVLDHNTINGVSGNYLQLVEQSNASYLGVGQYGDNSWAQPENYGSANFLYFENNTFNDAGATENEGSAGAYENQGGGRVVARFNTFNITDNYNVALAWHGTESSGRPRSTRAYEFYENTWTCNTGLGCPQVVGTRGGTGLTWGNTLEPLNGSIFNTLLGMDTYRTQGSISLWGACDGSSPYDTNDNTTYYSGTIGSVTGSFTITVSGTSPGWATNQWSPNGAPYSVHDVTQNTGTEITANSANTLTVAYGGGPGSWTPNVGDSIQILRATVCIDQAGGSGAGTLYSGTTPQSTGANEKLSPAYLWMNTASAGSPTSGADTARVIANRDYFMEPVNQGAQTNNTTPFNGSSSVGHGTLASRPTTCTLGVGYWATDQGSWNQSGSGGQGQLYLCTATNSWSLYYTPFTYPHPLVSGSTTQPTAPAPPTSLNATAQ